MADPKGPERKPQERSVRGDDDDADRLIQGGEGVRPLTPHTPTHTRDSPELPRSRAATVQISVQAASDALSPEGANALEFDPALQRQSALHRIEAAAASLNDPALGLGPSGGNGAAPAVVDDDAATLVNPMMPAPASPKKAAPRPRRRSLVADDDEDGPATIKIPVMTPSRLREFAALDDKEAMLALENAESSTARETPPQKERAAKTLSTTPLDDSAAQDVSDADTRIRPSPPAPTPGKPSREIPHSHFAEATIRANIDDVVPADARHAYTSPQPRSASDEPAVDDNPMADATRVSAPPSRRSETEIAEGPTSSANAPTGEESGWEEPTVAEAIGVAPTDSGATGNNFGGGRAAHRVATIAPVPALSAAFAPPVPDAGADGEVARAELPPPPVQSGALPALHAPASSSPATPPPAPRTFHDDDDVADDAVAKDVAAEDAAKQDATEHMRQGAAAAIAQAEADFEAEPKAPLPETIGVYKIVSLLGEGGMAEVFRAQHPTRGDVVLKRMRPSLLVEKRYVEMFIREAKIATTLHHPNIVDTLDFGAVLGAHYLVMEELVGMSLRDFADRVWEAGRSLPLEVILRSCAGAARGLHHAHVTASLVHRDVSPDNVFVTGAGPTKMLDFGIAKQPDSSRLTRTGEIKGKVPFMSPEHILGDPPVCGQSDVWSLGVTLYWLLCGVRPFDGTTDVMTLQAIVETPHAPVRQRNPAIPEDVGVVVDTALNKRLTHRYATALEFAEALDRAARRLVDEADDARAMEHLDRQVVKALAEAQALPLPNRPARAPYPAAVSILAPPPALGDDARLPTEAMIPAKKSATLWLIAGMLLGAMGAFVLLGILFFQFVLPKILGSEG